VYGFKGVVIIVPNLSSSQSHRAMVVVENGLWNLSDQNFSDEKEAFRSRCFFFRRIDLVMDGLYFFQCKICLNIIPVSSITLEK